MYGQLTRFQVTRSTPITLHYLSIMPVIRFLCLIITLAFPLSVFAEEPVLPLERIKLPPGFSITLWARASNVRDMALGQDITVFAGSLSAGKVYAIREYNGSRQVHVIASGLDSPAGVAWHNGSLYISTVSRILRLDQPGKKNGNPEQPVVVISDYPTEKHQGSKSIAFGPDGMLYVPVGAPCNICEANPERYALISRIKPDGTGYEIYAQGVRHAGGLDWHPETGELWFTDTGRDWISDDTPPDELNHAPRKGLHFGYPYCHAGDIPDPKFGAKRDCKKLVAPVAKLPAHGAAAGLRFYTGSMFPAEYRNQIFVAEHGSPSHRTQNGYRLKLVKMDKGKIIRQETFAEGWLHEQTVWGKPSGLLVMPDGSLLVSDDYAGAIYRISYKKP